MPRRTRLTDALTICGRLLVLNSRCAVIIMTNRNLINLEPKAAEDYDKLN